jgi:hypothetical protein
LRYHPDVADRDAPNDPLRTALAAEGVNLSALFFVVFENLLIEGNPPRRPRMMAPAGPSTAGGRLARQHLTLEPEEGHPGAAVVCGWADPARRMAELRTFRALDQAHYERFGQHLEMDAPSYARFLNEVKAFLIEQSFGVSLLDHAPGHAPAERGSSPWVILAVVLLSTLVLGVGLGAAWVLLVER